MGSFYPPNGAYQPDDIKLLQDAFDAAWAELATHRHGRDSDDDLRTIVSARLCDLAATGIKDPEQLTALTIASLQDV
jgi:hypothetical protein